MPYKIFVVTLARGATQNRPSTQYSGHMRDSANLLLLNHSSFIPLLRILFQPAISVVETQAQSALEKPIFIRA